MSDSNSYLRKYFCLEVTGENLLLFQLSLPNKS